MTDIFSVAGLLLILRILHVIGACALVGSVAFHYLILRRAFGLIPPAYAVVIGQRVGTEFNYLGWAALAILGVTGLARILIDGRFFRLLTPEFYASPADRALVLMIIGWAISMLSAAVMTVLLRPVLMSKLSARDEPDSAAVVKRQTDQTVATIWMGRLQVVTLVFSTLAATAGASVMYGGLF